MDCVRLKAFRLICAAAWLVAASAGVTAAQTAATATLRGRIVDPQDRPVPGAHVTATAATTGWTREVVSDQDGRYVLPDLPPDGFAVAVTATGFAPQRFESLTLRVGQILDLDASLTVAGVREDVVVDASGAGLVDTARSVVDAVITGSSIRSPAAQRAQLHGAGAAGPRQRAGAQLRSDQDQLRRHLLRRSARPRRQHQHRRDGQQRRRGGRAAAEHRAGGRAGVPDCDQPLCRRPRPVGRLGHQRRHAIRRRRAPRLGLALLP